MKNLNTVAVALGLALAAGNLVAQDSGMAKDAMGHETTQAHEAMMKKHAMTHDAMKKDSMSKGKMGKAAMARDAKSGSMMKEDKAGDERSQH